MERRALFRVLARWDFCHPEQCGALAWPSRGCGRAVRRCQVWGASQTSSSLHVSQVELTTTWPALHLPSSPRPRSIIPAPLLRGELVSRGFAPYFQKEVHEVWTCWLSTWCDLIYLSGLRGLPGFQPTLPSVALTPWPDWGGTGGLGGLRCKWSSCLLFLAVDR